MNNYFLNNFAIYGEDEASYAIRMEIEVFEYKNNRGKILRYSTFENSQRIILNQICPGNIMQYELIFYLVDHYDKIVKSVQG